MHKREIMRLFGLVKQDGYSLIPLSVYFKNSLIKVQVGLCKGKKLYDKRADLAAKAAKRDIDRAMKEEKSLTECGIGTAPAVFPAFHSQYGDVKVSTGIGNLGKRAAVRSRYKIRKLKSKRQQ